MTVIRYMVFNSLYDRDGLPKPHFANLVHLTPILLIKQSPWSLIGALMFQINIDK